jgi:hypothetical protein
MRQYRVRINQNTHFGSVVAEANSVLAEFRLAECCDITQLLALIQYRQATLELVEPAIPEPSPDADLHVDDLNDQDGDLDGDLNGDQGDDLDGDEANEDDVDGDIDADEDGGDEDGSDADEDGGERSQPDTSLSSIGFDEGLVEALSINGINSRAELQSYIDSGKDLVDLAKIGVVRVKKILELLESAKQV